MSDEWAWTIAEVQAAPEKALAYIRKIEAVASLERVLVALATQSEPPTEQVIEIDEDGHVSHLTIINEGGRLRVKRQGEGTPAAHHYGNPLMVKLEHGALVIRIGVDVLAHALKFAPWCIRFDEGKNDYIQPYMVTDATELAKDVLHAMLREKEDGSTPLSDFLDKMTESAIEDGTMGVDEDPHSSNPYQTEPAPAAAVERTPHQHNAVLADRVERYLKNEKESSHKRLVLDLVAEVARLSAEIDALTPPTGDRIAAVRALLARLENYYQFECEGGPLRNCVEWQKLKDAVLAAAPPEKAHE